MKSPSTMKSPMYVAWQSIIQRCLNPKRSSFKYYGAVGFTVCPEWQGVSGFQKFSDEMMERPEKTVINIREGETVFNADNCFWTTERKRKKRAYLTIDNRTQSVEDWVSELGLSKGAIDYRVKNWPANAVSVSKTYGTQSPEEKRRRYLARKRLRYAIISGRIIKPPTCQLSGCGLAVADGHHEDYDRPLDVVWLCHEHHKQEDLRARLEAARRIS